MAEPEPPVLDRWLARGLLVGGLWYAGTGLWGLARAALEPTSDLLVHLPGIGAGLVFLAGAWRMRAALRWDPPNDE
jgi:hypothetical protein